MRTIKFRGKRLDGEWVYGYYATILNKLRVDPKETIIITPEGYYEVIPESVGQWTSLVDRHGKEIYEGDIAKEDDSNWGYGGEYDTTHDGYLYNPVEFRNGAFYIGDNLLGEWSGFEIIGNIHDKICDYKNTGCGSCEIPKESRECSPELMEV